ncbi:MAG: DegT/DnrJ/EryC1/StrS family aminotransferase [Desulfovibrionales bacterium]
MSTPFIAPSNPKAGYLAYKDMIDQAVHEVLQSGWYIQGSQVGDFEKEFAAYLGVDHVLGVGSGTEALELALRTCGVTVGDPVLTVSHTAVATIAAIESVGAIPVFVDIDPKTFTMDPAALEKTLHALSLRPEYRPAKAVIPVHIYGLSCDMEKICTIAGNHGLVVIEDCAQSHGAYYQGKRTGSFGDMAAFSFYPTKNLGALGDGGAVATNNPRLAERAGLIKEYGWRQRYISEIPGINTRLDEIQAAVLRVKLRYLDEDNQKRMDLASIYSPLLSGLVEIPLSPPDTTHVYHQYVIRTQHRDSLQASLKEKGIGTLIHYPVPVHLQPAYSGRLPALLPLDQTERAAGEILSLPMYPELDRDDASAVGRAVSRWAAGKRSLR